MKELLTPKQVARAIGVSESSLKRWCDRGMIATERTAGGHRRLRLNAVLGFLREHGHDIQHPEVLGLPSTTGKTEWTVDRAKTRLREALIAGDDAICRQVVVDIYLAGQSVSTICDQVIAGAFHEIGDLWGCGDVEVYQERRACEISVRILHELRTAIPSLPTDAPRAIGGCIEGDQYWLPVTMAELVLRDTGWNATSLGNCLPFATLQAAIEQNRPALFWLSISHIPDVESFITQCNQLYDFATEREAAFIVGGRALTTDIRKQLRFTAHCDTMQHLESIAATLRKKVAQAPTTATTTQ